MNRCLYAMLCMVLAATAAQATVYDYTGGGLNGSEWTLEKWASDGLWDTHMTGNINSGGTGIGFNPVPGGDGYSRMPARGALTWDVLQPGEYIESVTFSYWANTGGPYFRPRAYVMGATEMLSDSTATAWDGSTGWGWSSGTETLTFTEAENVKKIGLGMWHTDAWQDWAVGISNVTITTAMVPEPMTVALLGAGLVGMLRRRK